MDEPVQPGEVLALKYRVDRVLGVGGMGVVVAATHLELDQRVALKFMHAGVFATDEARSRFQREARIASKLKSEHVARVSDTGTLANGAPYIVMEYLDGTDLSAQLAQYGPMPVGFAAECIVQACDAIGEAHSHGIVHRDLKPANLFLTQHPDGSPLVKVLDFGISKASGGIDAGMAMTKTGALMGSPLYMSPEQMRSLKTVDARTDVWALGVILYELLTGRTPFQSETFGDLLLEVMSVEPPPLRQLRPDAPVEISMLIERCLKKDPAARVQSVAEVAAVLAPFCSASGVVLAQRITALAHKSGTTGDPRRTGSNPALALSGAGSPGATPATVTAPGWSDSHGPAAGRASPKGPPWMGIGAVVAFAAVAVAALFMVFHGPHAPVAATEVPASASAPVPTPPPPPVAAASTAPTQASAPSTASSPDVAPGAPDTTNTASRAPVKAPPRTATTAATPSNPPHVAGVSPARPPSPTQNPPPPPPHTTTPGILDTSN